MLDPIFGFLKGFEIKHIAALAVLCAAIAVITEHFSHIGKIEIFRVIGLFLVFAFSFATILFLIYVAREYIIYNKYSFMQKSLSISFYMIFFMLLTFLSSILISKQDFSFSYASLIMMASVIFAFLYSLVLRMVKVVAGLIGWF